ncbi:MAG: virginiamycin B lyase family protein [Candidatus Binataceae bacterium]
MIGYPVRKSATPMSAKIMLALTSMICAAALSGCFAAGKAGSQVPPEEVYVTKQQLEAPYAIAAGDGYIWFSEYQNNVIVRFAPDGRMKRFRLSGDGFPERLTAGPGGAVWFTDPEANRIGRLSPDGKLKFYAVPTPNSGADGITAGPGGTIWFTEHAADRIGVISAGKVIEYTLPNGGGPAEIIAGRGGSLWFSEDRAGRIGKISKIGIVREYRIPTPNSRPGGLAAGRNNTIWFTELAAGKIGRIDSHGKMRQFDLPVSGVPLGIARGPNGDIWVTFGKAHAFCTVSPDGKVTTLVAGAETYPGFIVMGPENALWFTEPNGRIGRLTPPKSLAEFALPSPDNGNARAEAVHSELSAVVRSEQHL